MNSKRNTINLPLKSPKQGKSASDVDKKTPRSRMIQKFDSISEHDNGKRPKAVDLDYQD